MSLAHIDALENLVHEHPVKGHGPRERPNPTDECIVTTTSIDESIKPNDPNEKAELPALNITQTISPKGSVQFSPKKSSSRRKQPKRQKPKTGSILKPSQFSASSLFNDNGAYKKLSTEQNTPEGDESSFYVQKHTIKINETPTVHIVENWKSYNTPETMTDEKGLCNCAIF